MSSWTNITIPRKRDISKIPNEARPRIISRAERNEVVSSEIFQQPVATTATHTNTKKSPDHIPNPRQYINKKIDLIPHPTAIELNFKDKSYVFVILRHIRNTRDNDLWISSYNSIRKYYKNKIVIIDDNSSINTVEGKLVNTEVIRSEFNGAGEILPYYYFLKNKWADRMIFLHDSMFINRPFRDNELEGTIKFHWYFNNNGEVRDTIKILQYISLLNNNKELYGYANNIESKWRGCFGSTSICNFDSIIYLENKYNIFSILPLYIRTRLDREIFERIFGIILYYENIIDDNNCSNFGNIVNYPGAFESEKLNIETVSHVLQQSMYNTAIIKVWRGR